MENNLGVELLRNNQYNEAKKHLEKAVALQPLVGKNWLNLGLSNERLGNYKKAKDNYFKAVQLDHEASGYEALGGWYLFYEHNSKAAGNILKQGLQRYSLNQRINLLYAVAEYQNGNKQEALVFATRAYQILPNQELTYVLYQIQNNLHIEIQ